MYLQFGKYLIALHLAHLLSFGFLHIFVFMLKNVPIQYKGFEEWASLIVQESGGIEVTSNTTSNEESVSLSIESPLINSSIMASSPSVLGISWNSTLESGLPGPPDVQANSATHRHGLTDSGLLLFLFMATMRCIMHYR